MKTFIFLLALLMSTGAVAKRIKATDDPIKYPEWETEKRISKGGIVYWKKPTFAKKDGKIVMKNGKSVWGYVLTPVMSSKSWHSSKDQAQRRHNARCPGLLRQHADCSKGRWWW